MKDGKPNAHRPDAAAPRNKAAEAKSEDLIGQNLRKLYDDVVAEPLPDRLKGLLEKLKSEESK